MTSREKAKRLLVFGPESVHTERWMSYMRDAGWHVDWVVYGKRHADAVAAIPQVQLEQGGRFVIARTIIDLLVAAVRLRRIVAKTGADVLQTHWLLGPAWIAALTRHQPTVATVWGSDLLLPFPRRRSADWLTRRLGRRLDAVTYYSEALSNRLRALGFPDRKLHRVLWGVEEAMFHPSSRDGRFLASLGLENDDPVVLSPRGVAPVYDPETVIRGFVRAARMRPSTLLVRVDDSDDEAWRRLETLVPDDLHDRVRRYTGVPRHLFPTLLAACDVVISIPRSEGFGMTLAEAIFCERPVVVSDIPQNREWVPDATYGELVASGDDAELAGALERVLRNPDAARAKATKAAGRARAIGRDDQSYGAALRLYETLLGLPQDVTKRAGSEAD
jgi:glycosyltransferase involved in cell wall biosynthesis